MTILTEVLEESMQCLSLIHGISYFWSNKEFFNREKFYKVSMVMKLPLSIIRQFPAYNLSIANLPVTSKYSGSIKRRYISIFLRIYGEDGKRILRRRTSIFSVFMENGLAFVQFILSIYIPWRVCASRWRRYTRLSVWLRLRFSMIELPFELVVSDLLPCRKFSARLLRERFSSPRPYTVVS